MNLPNKKSTVKSNRPKVYPSQWTSMQLKQPCWSLELRIIYILSLSIYFYVLIHYQKWKIRNRIRKSICFISSSTAPVSVTYIQSSLNTYPSSFIINGAIAGQWWRMPLSQPLEVEALVGGSLVCEGSSQRNSVPERGWGETPALGVSGR